MVSLKNITFKSSYNWFPIDILRLVRPLIAIFSPVQDHLNYYIYIIYSSNYVQNAFWQSGSDSRWILSKKIIEPPPFTENFILSFHFVFRMSLRSNIQWMSERYIWWVSDWQFSVKFRQKWPHRGRRWIIMMERCICMWKPCRAALTEGFSCEKGWPRLPVTMFTTRRKQHCPLNICRYVSWVNKHLYSYLKKGFLCEKAWPRPTKASSDCSHHQELEETIQVLIYIE